MDSTVDDVPDTAANRAAFGYSRKTEPHSPYPQVRCVYLSECGTHVIFAAAFTPCCTSELETAPLLLEQWLTRDMLLLWDRGFLDSALVRLARAKGAHVVGRLATGHLTRYVHPLCDGSYLAVLYEDPKHQRGKPLLVHYAIRVLMHQSAVAADLDPDRLSFTHAVWVLHEATWRFALTPVCEHPALLAELLLDLRSALLPPRRLRLNARVVKRTRSKYERKKLQHYQVPHIKQPFFDIVALI